MVYMSHSRLQLMWLVQCTQNSFNRFCLNSSTRCHVHLKFSIGSTRTPSHRPLPSNGHKNSTIFLFIFKSKKKKKREKKENRVKNWKHRNKQRENKEKSFSATELKSGRFFFLCFLWMVKTNCDPLIFNVSSSILAIFLFFFFGRLFCHFHFSLHRFFCYWGFFFDCNFGVDDE